MGGRSMGATSRFLLVFAIGAALAVGVWLSMRPEGREGEPSSGDEAAGPGFGVDDPILEPMPGGRGDAPPEPPEPPERDPVLATSDGGPRTNPATVGFVAAPVGEGALEVRVTDEQQA